MSDGHAIEGYFQCACGGFVPEHVGLLTGRRCTDCWRASRAPARVVEVIHAGSRMSMPSGRRRPKHGSKGSAATERLRLQAQAAALRRLRACYPEVYDMLYDEERARRGLLPLPRLEREVTTPASATAYYDEFEEPATP